MKEYTPLEDFEYKIENNKILLLEYKGNKKEINISPKYKIKGKSYNIKITSTFHGYPTIEKITIPNSIKKIPIYTLSYCHSLKEIKLPNSIIEIGQNCFRKCEQLESIILPKNLKRIGLGSFGSCRNLKEVVFPKK